MVGRTGVNTSYFPHAVLIFFCTTLATPSAASTVPPLRHGPAGPSPAPTARPAPHRLAAAALYSRRSRRLVQSYLRLKLLEMREADLDRARRVIQRKLRIGDLLSETPPPLVR